MKNGAVSKEDAYNMAENKKLENIITKLYYQEMVEFQLRETKELRVQLQKPEMESL